VPVCNDVVEHEFVERVQHNVVKIGRPVFLYPRC
jgi:predicted transcriptional regulator